ncbi:MAG: hypothetical protein H7Z42_04300 [Roseiflexaceae bacterium]|nr:hypothetical protein [Roseiflexaceae bacterium]
MFPCDYIDLELQRYKLAHWHQKAQRALLDNAERPQFGQRLVNAAGQLCLRLGARLSSYGQGSPASSPPALSRSR